MVRGRDELYKSKAKRDARAKQLKARGFTVKRGSIRAQQIHPQYIEDEASHLRKQTGFGNTVYKTFYAVLYSVAWR